MFLCGLVWLLVFALLKTNVCIRVYFLCCLVWFVFCLEGCFYVFLIYCLRIVGFFKSFLRFVWFEGFVCFSCLCCFSFSFSFCLERMFTMMSKHNTGLWGSVSITVLFTVSITVLFWELQQTVFRGSPGGWEFVDSFSITVLFREHSGPAVSITVVVFWANDLNECSKRQMAASI